MKIEHIGIAVGNIEEANLLFEKLLSTAPYKMEEVETEKVVTSFFDMHSTKLELVAATSEESVITKYISKKGNGIHHIALAVEDIYSEIQRLKTLGFEFINEEPKKGADHKLICFMHPRSTQGILVELCQDIKN